MTEEEIIKILNDNIENCNAWLEDNDIEDIIWWKNQKQAIEGLLDLYKQEKENNKELEKNNKRLISDNEILREEINNDYIHKQVVKAKIKELDAQQRNWIEDRTNKHSDAEIIYARDILQELLEEE